ncbi:MAG: FAD-dependent oxidoreductase, partial [Deltaproteobacteria bacterium]
MATLYEAPRYVNMDRCIACGVCASKCPKKVPDLFNEGLDTRKAAYVQYAQAVPLKYAIDAENCIYFEKGKCRACEKFCPSGAIDFSQRDTTVDIDVGAVILAAGIKPAQARLPELYGYDTCTNVVTAMQFERILSATGPYQGHILRPSDGQPPGRIAWLQCVGSRNSDEASNAYCSGVCCMYSIKEAVIAKEHMGETLDASIFYMDMRTHGKDFDKYLIRAREESGIRLIRSRVHSVEETSGASKGVKIVYADEAGRLEEDIFDLVVLSTGLEVSNESKQLAVNAGVALDPDGFVQTDGLTPVETSRRGVFVCGGLAGPADIPQSVTAASAAASEAAALIADARHTCTEEKVYPPEKTMGEEAPRIGVFVCHCGINIASVVKVDEVKAYAETLPNVVYAGDNLFTCSQDTQQIIKDTIEKHRLNRVVVAACTPRTHEPLFQETIREAGLNPYLLEFANIRDQDAWVHRQEPEEATIKAKDLVRMAVFKVTLSEPVSPVSLDVDPSALIVGGGVAGMVAAKNLADQGFKSCIVEQKPDLGGHASHIRETWKGEDVQAYLEKLRLQVLENSRIKVLTNATIASVNGFVGNFISSVKVGDETIELKHGAAILAPGADYLRPHELGYPESSRITCWHGLEDKWNDEPEAFEHVRAIGLVLCAGSRTPDRPYCSKVCCTAAVQQAVMLKRERPDLDVYVLYRDLRTYGQREHLYREARERGVLFFRYDAETPPVIEETPKTGDGPIRITLTDHVLGVPVQLAVDRVNLYTAIVSRGQEALARLFKVPLNEDGFFVEAHMKLRPVDFSTEGVFTCGMAHYPKPMDEAILQAGAAAARAGNILAKPHIEVQPLVSEVNPDQCIGCGLCEASCPFGAIRLITVQNGGRRAENIPALCKGCGICAANCPQRAIDMVHFRDIQISAAIEAGGQMVKADKHEQQAAIPRFHLVSGYRVADDYFYHFGHCWIRREPGNRLRIGVDDFAAKIFGAPDRFKLPREGDTLTRDRIALKMAREDHHAPFLSPVTGKVFAINPLAATSPEDLFED